MTPSDQEARSGENSPRREGVRPESPWPLVVLLVSVVALWFASAMLIDRQIPATTQDAEAKRGQFGDKFGAINSLFSGLAFACLIYATFLQRRELALQREELGHTREELKLTREETAAQTALFQKQLATMEASHKFAVERELHGEDVELVPKRARVMSKGLLWYAFVNGGAVVYRVTATATNGVSIEKIQGAGVLGQNQFVGVAIKHPDPQSPVPFDLTFEYHTASDRKCAKRFRIEPNSLPRPMADS